jgi:tRNA-dihydrouridine synthase B
MAGVADSAFRLIARANGASLVYTELVSADGLVRDSAKTWRIARFSPEEKPIGVQLFGTDPGVMAEAAARVREVGPDLIDLNFGCPSKHVVHHGAGAAQLKDLSNMESIVRAVVSSVSLPVTAKIRSGWDDDHIVAADAARILEGAGVRAVTIHARTMKMGFRGEADWNIIRNVKQAVSIPVVGNGDVCSVEDARRLVDKTGCDLVMIGRGAMGRPWIFDRVNQYLENGEIVEDPDDRERIEQCLNHYHLALRILGEERGVKEMRKHIGWYLKGMRESAQVRKEVFTMTDPKEVEKRLLQYVHQS